jgi:copper homeostasis protein (lipoprotein)
MSRRKRNRARPETEADPPAAPRRHWRRIALGALVLAAALAGCVTISSSSIGTFAGVLPCGDCAGILTELRLYAEQPSGQPTRYELTETYLGAVDGRGSLGTAGRWATLRGSAADANATLIQLDLGRIDALKNFLRVGDDELRLLDRNKREIVANVPHSLHRVLEIPAATLVESDSGQTIDVERGQRVFVVLGSGRAAGYRWTLDPSSTASLTSLSNPVYVPEGSGLGAGGSELWFFGATLKGKQELRFQYRRAFEPDSPAVKTVSFTVNVR